MLRRGSVRIALSALTLGCFALFTGLALAAPTFGSRTLRIGARGPDVKQLQTYLVQLGIRTPRDGIFGRRTAAAVKAFERREGQRRDGRVNPTEAQLIEQLVWDGADSAHSAETGGISPDGYDGSGDQQQVSNPTSKARISSDGHTAIAPNDAPPQVKAVIAAANKITEKPYRYGGGHGKWNDTGYDCSGSVSFALHGAGLVPRPFDSTDFESWGSPGRGQWITVWTNAGHAFAIIAGLRFDTAGGSGMSGPRWRPTSTSTQGFMARHDPGL